MFTCVCVYTLFYACLINHFSWIQIIHSFIHVVERYGVQKDLTDRAALQVEISLVYLNVSGWSQ